MDPSPVPSALHRGLGVGMLTGLFPLSCSGQAALARALPEGLRLRVLIPGVSREQRGKGKRVSSYTLCSPCRVGAQSW